MSVKDYTVHAVGKGMIKDFVKDLHYTHSIHGVRMKYNFALMDGGDLIGAAVYGQSGMPVWTKYVEKKKHLIELRRLVCVDEAPTNTESYFVGQTLKWLKNNTLIKKVISYADPAYGHEGTIYKATNFEYLGKTSPYKVIMYNGKRYHARTKGVRYGKRSPKEGYYKPIALKLQKALENGEAEYKKEEGKHIYLYDLESRRSEQEKEEIKRLTRGLD